MKKQLKILFLLGSSYFLFTSGNAQDLHFSQYFANPISYNPAQTGFFDGSYRFGVNHKQQWPWAIDGKFVNYNSSSAFTDFSILDKKINDLDWAGVGVNFINDQAGDGNLVANKSYFSMAYHKGLDRYHKQFLSIGFTLGYVYRSIDFSALYFNNQWVDRVGFDLSLPSFENINKENTSYIDLGIGLQGRNQIGQKINLSYGFSWLHINRPKESFYQQDNRLGLRHLMHLAIEYKISQRIELMGSAYFTYQKKGNETLFGTMANFAVGDNSTKQSKLFAGTFYRFRDAISPIVGYQYHHTRVLLNYDINLSTLSKTSRGNGGFEISLVHTGSFKRKRGFNHKVYCPKF